MAEQKRFLDYKSPVESFPLAQQKVGLLVPGRYSGFDEVTSLGNTMSITVTHSAKIRKTDKQGVAQNKFGAILMPTGVVIHEHNDLSFTLLKRSETPGGGVIAQWRTDLLVCEHNYTEVVGGVPATYFIVTGGSSGSAPSLPDPTKQVILGEFRVAGEDFTSVTYTPRMAALNGDISPAQLYKFLENPIRDAIQQYGNTSARMLQYLMPNPFDFTLTPQHCNGGHVIVNPDGGTTTVTIPDNVTEMYTRITMIGVGQLNIVRADQVGFRFIDSQSGHPESDEEIYLSQAGESVILEQLIGVDKRILVRGDARI